MKIDLPPFKEALLSWNGKRSAPISLEIRIRVHGKWSQFLPYATWNETSQCAFKQEDSLIKIDQDEIHVKKGLGESAEIRISNPTPLHNITLAPRPLDFEEILLPEQPLLLPVKGFSQMEIPHKRYHDLCSPTTTAMLIHHITKKPIDPASFANEVHDSRFDIYGNWVLNVAAASTHLGNGWRIWAEKLLSFTPILCDLEKGYPVAVSVRGPLSGSALAYQTGHLMLVIGFEKEHVICLDPAFPTADKTKVRYLYKDFLAAWKRRDQVAYRIAPQDKSFLHTTSPIAKS